MTIKVLVNGAFGRMGQITVKAIVDHPDLTLVGQIGREYDLKKSIKDSHADVVIDFTSPTSVYDNTCKIIEASARPVIGTSGLSNKQVDELKQLAATKKLGGIVAPNFSLGAVLMMKYAKSIAKYLPRIEIIEMHHDRKIDSPSATAIRTAQLIAEHMQSSTQQPDLSTQETIAGARGAKYEDIAIHSIRLPGILARQDIIFGNTGETLTLSHNSIDRQCFMPGVFFACQKVMTLNELVYGLEEIV